MRLIREKILKTIGTAPTISSGISSSELVDMAEFRNVLLAGLLHRLPNALGEGVATLSVWESTASTWDGAVAIQIADLAVTASLTSASDVLLETEVRAAQMGVNFEDGEKQYIGSALVLPTTTTVAVSVDRGHARYEPAE